MKSSSTKGQTVAMVMGVVSLVSAIATPVLWLGKIEAKNDVQDVKIESAVTDVHELKGDVKEINNKINALLIKNGINPETLKQVSFYN